MVTAIRIATNTAGKPISTGKGQAGSIAITPDGKVAYVADSAGTMTPVCTATNSAGRPIKVGKDPAYVAITR
jgi:DNA-binding beta-propeller fold protein YncE